VRRRARRALAGLLLTVARSRPAGAIIGRLFAHGAAWLPVKRLYLSDLVIAFAHPRPSYPVHILIVPRHAIRGLSELSDADAPLLVEVLRAARHVARRLRLEERGYRLVVNGGGYQEVQQLHVHLIYPSPPRR
jgi:histidine triad (HIT) family protein